MNRNLVIKRLEPDMLVDVQFLAKAAFNVNYSLEYLNHKYSTSAYCGNEFLCTIGYIDSQPVAFYGGIPQLYNNVQHEKKYLLVQTCDSYTHPDHQGKGLHQKLALASYEIMKENNVKAVFALHSENTFHSCLKLDWNLQTNLLLYQMNLSVIFPLQKVLDKFSFLKSFSDKRVDKVLNKHFDLSDQFINEHCIERIGAYYSDEFINYKNKYRCYIVIISGCKLWIRIKSVVYVGAIHNLNSENLKLVIKGLKRLCKALGTDKIIIELDPRHSACKLLETEQQGVEAYKVGYKCLDDSFDFSKVSINYLDFDNFM